MKIPAKVIDTLAAKMHDSGRYTHTGGCDPEPLNICKLRIKNAIKELTSGDNDIETIGGHLGAPEEDVMDFLRDFVVLMAKGKLK